MNACIKAGLGAGLVALLEMGAIADLTENFDVSTALPTGWAHNGTANDTVSGHWSSAPNCRALGAGKYLQAPAVDYPTRLSLHEASSTSGAGKLATVDYSLDGTNWIQLAGFAVSKAGSAKAFPLTNSPNLSASPGIRFRFNSTFSTWYLDDVAILTAAAPPTNAPPFLSLVPSGTNRTVLVGEAVVVVATATEADGDEVSLSGANLPAGSVFEPNPLSGVAPLTNTFAWTPTIAGEYRLVFRAEDKDGADEKTVRVQVAAPDPTLLLAEDFDATAALPASWTDENTINDTGHFQSAPNCRALRINNTLTTPAVDYPTNISFYSDVSNAGDGQTAAVACRIGAGPWIQVGSCVVKTAGATESFSLAGLPEVMASAGVQFRFTSPFSTWYVDNVRIHGQNLKNQPPVLAPIGPQAAAPGQVLSLLVTASDFDGNDIALYASNLPPGAVFAPVTNAGVATSLFCYEPQADEIGLVHVPTFYAADRDGVAEETVAISVHERLVEFACAQSLAWEDEGVQRVAVAVSSPGDVTVYVTAGGTATRGAGGDYLLGSTQLVFTAEGSTTQYLEVAILEDARVEVTESVILTLTQAVGASLSSRSQHVLTLRDNEAALFEPLSSNPRWSVEGQWAFGRPLGGVDGYFGYADPKSGYTGTNVYGYNLVGNYPANIRTTYYLTTPAIDCSRFRNVRLDFQRWLGIDYSVSDQAVIQASVDGAAWVDVWRHNGSEILDSKWTNVVYDLSTLADGQPAVYIRWGLGPTDNLWNFGGWNLDDIAVRGEAVTNAMFRFAAERIVARETGAVAQVTIERVNRTNVAAEIGFATDGGAATPGADYEAVAETLAFAPGEVRQTVSLVVHDDLEVEGEETILLRLVPTATGDTGSPAAATLILLDDEAPGAAIPFFDGFEAGESSSEWVGASTGAGRIEIGPGSLAPYDGDRHLCLDSSGYNQAGLNEMVLTVDLTGQTNLVLDFQEYNLDYQLQPMPAEFTGSVEADGVAVSGDGVTWLRLYEQPEAYWGPYGYTNRAIDLSAFAVGHGLALDAHFKIKFQQYDVYPLPYLGRCFDNIQVYDPTQVTDVRLAVQASEDPVQVGSELVYTLRVTNAGPRAAAGVVVSNALPEGVAFVSAGSSQGGCTQQERWVVCELGDLPRGGSAVVAVTVVPSVAGTLVNQAWAGGALFDPDRTNNRVETTTVADERGGTLQMYFERRAVDENSGRVTLGAIRTDRTYGAVSVEYATEDGTAVAGEDYVAAAGTLVFSNGQTVALLTVELLDDAVAEPGESFSVVLSNPGGEAILGERVLTAIDILDDDGRAAFPFHESFESGALTNVWRTYSTGDGRIAVTTNNGPCAGERHLTMDTSQYYSNALNELVLTIDLAGRKGVTLGFWHRHFGNTSQTMPSAFAGHSDSDGVAISVDGTNWAKVQGLTAAEGASNAYRYFEVALDPIVAQKGWTYPSTFKVKFQQFDNYPIPYRGFAFDEISLFSRPGELRFGQAAWEVSETGGVAIVTVERVNGSLGEVSVAFATADGTAAAGADYVATNGVLTFADGATTGSFAVALIDDEDDEPAETVWLTLSDPAGGATLAAPSHALLTVGDDDGPGTFVFAAELFTVSESNGTATIAVRRVDGAKGEATVEYAASDGTALDGLDYVAATGTLVFAVGVTQREFSVSILDDEEQEGGETLFLTLGNPGGGASIGEPGAAILNIVDDEDPNYAYYAPAFGKAGAELRQALHDIIDDHVAFSYDAIWTLLQQTDECPTNANQVQLVYMQTGRDKSNRGGGAGQWNREHLWPQSHGFPDALSISVPPSVDAHNLKPADVQINSLRGEKDFDEGGAAVAGAPATCRTTAGTFEPPDAAKGDVARAMFYMDVRYSGDVAGEPDLQLVEAVDTSGTQLGKLSTLIRWHFQDPPDEFEKRRNDLIHRNWQGNRNPFVDHPEWVLKVWEYNLAIATAAGAGGAIAPANPQVPYHSDQFFEIRPEPYWHIADIRTNGVSLGVAGGTSSFSFVWSQVVANGTLEAVFAENLAANGTPEWWLAGQGFTNDFDAAALGDPDEDGFPTWQEFRAGTDPNAAASRLQFEGIGSEPGAGEAVLRWQSASNRTYSVWRSFDLTGGSAERLAAGQPATPPVNVYTDGAEGLTLRFYFIEVEP